VSDDEEEDRSKKKVKKNNILNLKKLTVVGMCQIGITDESFSQFQSFDEGTGSPRTEANYFEAK
jgi:hypothetical protein